MLARLLLLIAGAALGALALAWAAPQLFTPAPAPAPRIVTPRGELSPGEETLIALFEATRGSVVSITTAGRVFDPWSRRAMEVPRGTGSGFVWDEAGHIVTNAHVVEGASAAQVGLADGTMREARLVGADPRHDLAVLKIDMPREGPPPLPIGTSADLRVGQFVMAIGNPFGLDWTLTTGIVSALDREIPGDAQLLTGLIQTDAAINPGNSGGPLIDSSGRLIGVNTAIFSPSGSSAGIGFAVPVDTVGRVVPQLIAHGVYRPPYLGVVHDERVNALARQQGIGGVVVLEVEPGSPAAEAGLRPVRRGPGGGIVLGDRIAGVDGARIEDSEALRAALDARRPGDTIRLAILRGDDESEIDITLAPPR